MPTSVSVPCAKKDIRSPGTGVTKRQWRAYIQMLGVKLWSSEEKLSHPSSPLKAIFPVLFCFLNSLIFLCIWKSNNVYQMCMTLILLKVIVKVHMDSQIICSKYLNFIVRSLTFSPVFKATVDPTILSGFSLSFITIHNGKTFKHLMFFIKYITVFDVVN